MFMRALSKASEIALMMKLGSWKKNRQWKRKLEKNLDLIKEQISTRLNLLSREIHNNRPLKQYMWTGY